MVVILIIRILASIVLASLWHAWRSSRLTMARNTLISLSGAIHAYEQDMNSYPPGDGRGSAVLIKALGKAGARHHAYFEPPADQVDPAGNLRSPLDPEQV